MNKILREMVYVPQEGWQGVRPQKRDISVTSKRGDMTKTSSEMT